MPEAVNLQKRLNIERNEEVKRLHQRVNKISNIKNDLQKQINELRADIWNIKMFLERKNGYS
jgi:hypothetical protein